MSDQKRVYDTSKETTKPGVEIPKEDWKLMRDISKRKGLRVWAALTDAVRDWNKKNKGV